MEHDKLVEFLIEAKRRTYAGHGAEVAPSRPNSHDLRYAEGELMYYDTYLGGELFSGEEAVWLSDTPIWCMNYTGRVIGQPFSGDFLKEALSHVEADAPFRGPASYISGDYTYECKCDGCFDWFQGYETISYKGRLIYDCYYHGGVVK